MGVQQHIVIIYIRISSEVTNTSILPLNQDGIISLSTVINTSGPVIITKPSSQLFPQLYSSRTSDCTICYWKFLQSQPFFHVGCRTRPHPGLHQIHEQVIAQVQTRTILYIAITITCVSYRLLVVSDHRVGTTQDLLYIATKITYVSYHHLVIIMEVHSRTFFTLP